VIGAITGLHRTFPCFQIVIRDRTGHDNVQKEQRRLAKRRRLRGDTIIELDRSLLSFIADSIPSFLHRSLQTRFRIGHHWRLFVQRGNIQPPGQWFLIVLLSSLFQTCRFGIEIALSDLFLECGDHLDSLMQHTELGLCLVGTLHHMLGTHSTQFLEGAVDIAYSNPFTGIIRCATIAFSIILRTDIIIGVCSKRF